MPQYQRSLGALPLLWKGVLTWVCQNPHYTKLFGPVSISQDYLGLSRKLIVEFLTDNKLHEDMATFVKPRKPFRYMKNRKLLREFISAELDNVDDFSAWVVRTGLRVERVWTDERRYFAVLYLVTSEDRP